MKKPNSDFILEAAFQPTGDQPQAIDKLTNYVNEGLHDSVLLGVTGSGKTYTVANVIKNINKPTLILSHNKTLAAQLYQEFRDFFPDNAVSYFVSYYDYYQPEAYMPQTDTYIEKETEINEEIDKLRLAATTNLLTRKDVIVVASVSCIYNIGSPREYGHFVLELRPGTKISRSQVLERLVQLQYTRSDYGFRRGTFRVRGDSVDLFPAYDDRGLKMVFDNTGVTQIMQIDVVTGKTTDRPPAVIIYPAKHFLTDPSKNQEIFKEIRRDLEVQVKKFKDQGKILEAHRINQRVNYDLEMIAEMGYVNGIENYSRYFDGRQPGSAPFTLMDYFDEAAGKKGDWLLVVDESHMTIPQVRGMYNGDRSRKQTLIDFGFRLPSALDNRPMRFDEFLRRAPTTIYVSATPDDWEISRAGEAFGRVFPEKKGGVVEQLLRPTGLTDPEVEVRPTENQIPDLMNEIAAAISRKQRTLVTTLTKKMAEDLTRYLAEKEIKVQYLHSDVLTLARSEILSNLRTGQFDVVIGVNLLREGLDLPEVSLVVIMDADREGFLRSRTSLVQTMGRSARNVDSRVILYADRMTQAMKEAIAEVDRRRQYQIAYNRTHNIVPYTITKPIRDRLVENTEKVDEFNVKSDLTPKQLEKMTPYDRRQLTKSLKRLMHQASADLQFEEAIRLRDQINKLKEN